MTDTKKKKDDRGNLKLPPELHRQLSHYAIDENLTLADVVRRAWECLQVSKWPWVVSSELNRGESSSIKEVDSHQSLKSETTELVAVLDKLNEYLVKCLGFQITGADIPWVKSFLEVRKSETFGRAIESNVTGMRAGIGAENAVKELQKRLADLEAHLGSAGNRTPGPARDPADIAEEAKRSREGATGVGPVAGDTEPPRKRVRGGKK